MPAYALVYKCPANPIGHLEKLFRIANRVSNPMRLLSVLSLAVSFGNLGGCKINKPGGLIFLSPFYRLSLAHKTNLQEFMNLHMALLC